MHQTQLFSRSISLILCLVSAIIILTSCERNGGAARSLNTDETSIDSSQNEPKQSSNLETNAVQITDEIADKWRFEYIQNEDGEALKPIGENDYMTIEENGSFYYILNEAKIESNGTWQLLKDSKELEFTYHPKENSNDTIVRTYQVNSYSTTTLVLKEKGIYYAFKK